MFYSFKKWRLKNREYLGFIAAWVTTNTKRLATIISEYDLLKSKRLKVAEQLRTV